MNIHDIFQDEEEPEWMSFGPNDRFEVIELKGLEEHEQEREGNLVLVHLVTNGIINQD